MKTACYGCLPIVMQWQPTIFGARPHERAWLVARLIFAPYADHPEHLARLAVADIFLDTLPYNAHTTASDALRCGVPIVTCPGQSFAARVAGSLLHAIGVTET